MLEAYGERRRSLLQSLLDTREGMSVDALAARLGITHNAVRQHLAALERDGLVSPGETRPTGGRPHQRYVLTDTGRELFRGITPGSRNCSSPPSRTNRDPRDCASGCARWEPRSPGSSWNSTPV